ncbi:hypothetical protein [Pedococcus bigeumensis]|uniref:Uncharacterized protein n=1 Tax=Pedococcus bigeumensis TaxID=433644 RepID=A0A502CVJ6_9MICO|nr:hypothetical protein [Pedococcus bigeumensis]TPG16938.1 hypothetical protein EAH86_09105 [Pedococcus bigeumensis]
MTTTPRSRPRSFGPVGLGPDTTTTSAGTPTGTLGLVTNLARFLRDRPPGIATRDLEGEPA